MSKSLVCVVWTTLGNWPEGRFVRSAICATVLICAFVLPGQTRPSGSIARPKQQGPVFCGWISVQVNRMTRAFADSLGMVEPYGAIFGQPYPAR
jgi:hypothetical protein